MEIILDFSNYDNERKQEIFNTDFSEEQIREALDGHSDIDLELTGDIERDLSQIYGILLNYLIYETDTISINCIENDDESEYLYALTIEGEIVGYSDELIEDSIEILTEYGDIEYDETQFIEILEKLYQEKNILTNSNKTPKIS